MKKHKDISTCHWKLKFRKANTTFRTTHARRGRGRDNTCATCTTLQATSHSTTQECQGAARRSTAQNGMDVRSLWGEQCTTMARVVRPACACSTFHHRAMLGWWMLFCLVWKLNPDFLTAIRFPLTKPRRTSLNSATLA